MSKQGSTKKPVKMTSQQKGLGLNSIKITTIIFIALFFLPTILKLLSITTYSEYEQVHFGNGVPIAELNGLTLNEVFEDGQLVSNGEGNTLTGWTFSGNVTTDGTFIVIDFSSTYSLIQSISGLNNEKYHFSVEYIGDGLAPASNLTVQLRQDTTTNSNVILIPNSTTTLTYLSGIFTTTGIFNQILFSRNSVGGITKIKNIRLFNITNLINAKAYSPIFDTTFDLMSDANIKTQMDYWYSRYQNNLKTSVVPEYLLDPDMMTFDFGRELFIGLENTFFNFVAKFGDSVKTLSTGVYWIFETSTNWVEEILKFILGDLYGEVYI